MKPVIKKQTVYSVLLMRDDCGVRRFRLRAFWLKLLFGLLALIVAGCVTASFLAHNYRKKYYEAQEENRDLERQLAEMRRRLEPLAYLEKIQEVSQNRLAGNGTGVAVAAGPAGANGVSSVSSVVAPRPANATAAQAGPGTVPPAQANQTRAATSLLAANATAAAQAAPGTASSAQAGLARQNGTSVDGEDGAHPAKISNVTLRAIGATRIRISFDLNNQDPQLLLNGRATLAVVTGAGVVTEVTQVDRADLSFRINSYKRVNTVFVLPANIQLSDVASVQITLSGDNVPKLTERFPMQ